MDSQSTDWEGGGGKSLNIYFYIYKEQNIYVHKTN